MPGTIVSRTGGARFGKRLRLSGEREFRSLLKSKRRVQAVHFIVQVTANELPYARLGIVVGKRAVARAVDRNFAKRVVRERFRRECRNLVGLDVLVRVRRQFVQGQALIASTELSALLSRLIS